jgi:hypothetical protein
VGGVAAGLIAGASSLGQTGVQGATIGQMLTGQGFMSGAAKSLYVVPKGQMVSSAGDFAQGNYYAAMTMGVQPNSQNFRSMERGANQLAALMPGSSYQQRVAAIGQMNTPGVLNAASQVGLNLRPGGTMQDAQSNFTSIFNRLFLGRTPDLATFYAVMGPGGNGEVNLASIGIQPGSDAYQAFMQYGITRINQGKKGMPDLTTKKGVKAAGLDTPAYAQEQLTTEKSRLQSRLEPSLADASKTLNEAATKLLTLADNATTGGAGGMLGKIIPGFGLGESILGKIPGVGGVLGGHGLLGGGLGSLVPGMGLGKSLLGKIPGLSGIFQEGGQVPGTGPSLAVVHGGEYVLNKEQVQKMLTTKDDKSQTGHKKGALDSESPLGMLLGKVTDIPNTALSALLSPAPQGSLVAALGGGGGGPVQPSQHGSKGTGGVPGGATIGLAPLIAASGKKGGGGILGDIASFFGIGGGGGGGAAGGGSTGGAKSASPYKWDYSKNTVFAADYSGLFTFGSQDGKSGSSPNAASGSGGTGASPASSTALTGSSNAQQAYNFFVSKGLKDYQAAAIVGNLAQESNVNPNTPGGGIAQWIGGRWNNLVNFAKAQNKPPTDLGIQLSYLWSELTGSEGGALAALRGASDVASATQAFEQAFERAGIPAMQNRIGYAQKVLASKGASYARGSQRIDRTQLALLHAGEAVVPAQDNYSSAPYNRGGQMGGGGGVLVHLDFRQGSIVLQVPATSSQQDMDQIAQRFVQAISKPQLLDAVRNT